MRKIIHTFMYTIVFFMFYGFSMLYFLEKSSPSFLLNEVPKIANIIFAIIYFIGLLFVLIKKDETIKKALLYTIALFMIYSFLIVSYEVPRIVYIIFIITYFIGLLFILFSKPNDTKNDNRLMKRLEMKKPTTDIYNSIKDNSKNVYIRCWNINPYNQKFFISDLEGNLLYKIKQKYGSTPSTYTIYDPFDNELGIIKSKMFKLMPTYEINIDNKSSFEIKRTMEVMNNNYKFENIPLDIKGDFWGCNYAVILKSDESSLVAEVNTTSVDGWSKLGNADIIIYENKYLLEIICSVVCSVLVKSRMERND